MRAVAGKRYNEAGMSTVSRRGSPRAEEHQRVKYGRGKAVGGTSLSTCFSGLGDSLG